MSCSVAVPSSPIFSPSTAKQSSIFKSFPVFCSSPRISHRSLHISPSSLRSPSIPRLSPSPLTPLGLSTYKEDEKGSGLDTILDVGEKILKRKRPARIQIPVESMNICVGSPKVVEKVEVIEVEGDGYSVYCKRGRRGRMEDRYSAAVNLSGASTQAFFGVFDGHGGSKAAEFAARNIEKNITNQLTGKHSEDVMEAVRDGYLTTDADLLNEDIDGGACCVTALIQHGNLVVSNAGDCRAVMSQQGIAEALTSDHRPSRMDEKDRIEALGGYVDCHNGVWRIQGSLAVSRGIGDRHLKQFVTAEPESKALKIKSTCEFLILASDGLWDKVPNQEAVDIARPFCVGLKKPDALSACKRLADLSVSRGSTDDICVMIIELGCFLS